MRDAGEDVFRRPVEPKESVVKRVHGELIW